MSETVQATANRLALELACSRDPKAAAEKIIGLESRLDQALADKKTNGDLAHRACELGLDCAAQIKALESRLSSLRSALNDVLVRNQNADVSDNDAMSELHELFYQHFQARVVEKL